MTAMEIALLVCGAAIFIVSFFLPEKGGKDGARVDTAAIKRAAQEAVSDEIDAARDRINDMVDETIRFATERAEVTMDRVSNEKMMALNEYSESVLGSIDKNHQEVLFLYDMLNEKSVDLKNTVREAQTLQKEAAEAIKQASEPIKAYGDVTLQQSAALQQGTMTESAVAGDGAAAAEHDFVPLSAIEMLAANSAAADRAIEKAIVKNESETAPKKRGPRKKPARSAANIDLALDEARTPGRNKNEMILRLHRQGKSNVEVARELGLGMGEVKLVIDLFEGVGA